jgi:DNA-directed RNA polymerase specialized sigma24 family protein
VSSSGTTRFAPLSLATAKRADALIPSDGPAAFAEGPDEALIAEVAAGSQDALACLFQRYAVLVRNVAARILRDRSEAEDLVQDLFLFIHRKAAIFDSSKGSARSWIVRVTYHRAISRRRYLATRHFYNHADVESMAEVIGVATTGDIIPSRQC